MSGTIWNAGNTTWGGGSQFRQNSVHLKKHKNCDINKRIQTIESRHKYGVKDLGSCYLWELYVVTGRKDKASAGV